MLKLATAEMASVSIWTDELERSGPDEASYWIDTLRRAKSVLPKHVGLWFLLGADQVAAFHRWRDPKEILKIAEPVVMLRPPMDRVETLEAALEASGQWNSEKRKWWLQRVAPIAIRAISATELRKVIASGGDPTGMLHPAVLEYIQRKGLYAS